MDEEALQNLVKVARGLQPADLVIKNGHYLDVFNCKFRTGDVAIYGDAIAGVAEKYQGKQEVDAKGAYIVPGFIDAHIHIESSMVIPSQFQQAVLPRGTTTVIWDPHEIANVRGVDGIKWALQFSKDLLLDIYLMLSSCVPALAEKVEFETSAQVLTAADLAQFHDNPQVLGLAEMMNVPGVLDSDADVQAKLIAYRDKIIDGHCPLLVGKDLNAYIAAGIDTEHEATELAEAKEKLAKGMAILIREGSSAENAETLLPLLNSTTAARLAFCTDDCNPYHLSVNGHLDYIINKGLKLGYKPELLCKIASYSAAQIYGLKDRGAIAPGYLADLCLIRPVDDDWQKGMQVKAVYKGGNLVTKKFVKAAGRKSYSATSVAYGMNVKFPQQELQLQDLHVNANHPKQQNVLVIGVNPGQLITSKLEKTLSVINGSVSSDPSQDVIKIAVFERHKKTGNYAVGFVQGFGLKAGAIAQTVNHDCHNLIVVGATDEAIAIAVNKLVAINGGIVVVDAVGNCYNLPLPVAGLMSSDSVAGVAKRLDTQTKKLAKLGCKLTDPFLQLAFLALPVIPSLKITDRGLIDVDNFCKIELLY